MSNLIKKDFRAWKKRINKMLKERYGLTIEDLPYYPYAGAFLNGDSPTEVVNDVIKLTQKE